MAELVIAPTQRVLIVGRTQTGKSTLARRLFYGVSRLVVIDTKWEEELVGGVTVYSPAEFRRLWPQRSTRVVFRPDPTVKKATDVGEVIARVLTYRRARIVVHEAVDLATPSWIEPSLRRALKTGAFLEVGTTICSQRPIGLHNDAIAESEHVFVFDLALPGDRDKLAELGVPGLLERAGEGHGFLYYGPTTGGAAIRCPPLRIPTDPRPAVDQSPPPGGTSSWSGRRSATSSPSR